MAGQTQMHRGGVGMPRFHPPIDKGPHQAAFTITAFRLGVLPEALRRAISGCVLGWQTWSGVRTDFPTREGS